MVRRFIGRRRELDVLAAQFREAMAGKGAIVLVGGEPGIGKSRLLEQAAAAAERAGLTVAWGRCWEGPGAPALWPWVQILRHLGAPKKAGATGEMRDEVARLFSGVADVRAGIFPDLDDDRRSQLFFVRLSEALRQSAARRPIALFFDDIHNADGPSAAMLSFLATSVGDAHLAVVAAYRDAEVDLKAEASESMHALTGRGDVRRLRLVGLNHAEIEELLGDAGLDATPELVRQIAERTEGNPLFLHEAIQLVLRCEPGVGETRLASLVPETLHQLLSRRLSALSEETRASLDVAAVIGREFDWPLLARARRKDAQALLADLDEAVRQQVIQPMGDRVHAYRFGHVLARDVLYDQLTSTRRSQIHAQVWAALGEAGAGDASHLFAAAHHAHRALPWIDPEQALEASLRAGERAVDLYAYQEAVGFFRQAIELAETLGPADVRLCELLLRQGGAARRAGKESEARGIFARAGALARQLGEPLLQGRAALGLVNDFTASGELDQRAITALEEAITAVGHRDVPLRIKLLSALAVALYVAPSAARRSELIQESIELAQQCGDPAAELFVLSMRQLALAVPEKLDESLAVARRAIDLALRHGDENSQMRGHMSLAQALYRSGDWLSADREVDFCTRLSEELRDPRYLWQVGSIRAARALLRGDFAQSEEISIAAWHIGREIGEPRADQYRWLQSMCRARACGGVEEHELGVRFMLERFPHIPHWQAGLALLCAEGGKRDEARSILQRVALNLRDLPRSHFWAAGMACFAETCWLIRDASVAGAFYDALAPFAGQTVVIGLIGAVLGTVDYYLALLAATLGRFDLAARHFRAALEQARSSPPLLARVQLSWAQAIGAMSLGGDPAEARGLVESALPVLRQLGMDRWLEEAAALDADLDRRGCGRPVAPPSRPSANAVHRFRLEGEYFTVEFEGRIGRLRATRGLRFIAELLRRPHQDVHVLDLVGGRPPETNGVAARHAQRDLDLQLSSAADVSRLLDPQARQQYRERLDELRALAREAADNNDLGRRDAVQREVDFLHAELAQAFRPIQGKRSPLERARVNVRNCITSAFRSLSTDLDPLARHLRNTIRTGTVCRYTPEREIHWEF